MRIEAREHAVDGILDHQRLVRNFNVVGANSLEDIAEQVELAIGIRRGSVRGSAGEELRLRHHHGAHDTKGNAGQ